MSNEREEMPISEEKLTDIYSDEFVADLKGLFWMYLEWINEELFVLK